MEYLGNCMEFSGWEWGWEYDLRRDEKGELGLDSEGPWVPAIVVGILSCWEWQVSTAVQAEYLFLVKEQTNKARQSQSSWSQFLL